MALSKNENDSRGKNLFEKLRDAKDARKKMWRLVAPNPTSNAIFLRKENNAYPHLKTAPRKKNMRCAIGKKECQTREELGL